jgi:hypothetical protein
MIGFAANETSPAAGIFSLPPELRAAADSDAGAYARSYGENSRIKQSEQAILELSCIGGEVPFVRAQAIMRHRSGVVRRAVVIVALDCVPRFPRT